MGMEGLKRVLFLLEADGLVVDTLVTDRHTRINAFLARKHPQIMHLFGRWHVVKGK